MSRSARLALLAAVVVAAAAAFLALKPKGSDQPGPPATAQPGGASPAPASQPAPRIRVAGGKPVGGIRKIRARHGQRVRFTVTSDVADEIHVHGYDLQHDLAPGQPAAFAFPASIEGVFEIELERRGRQIAELTVTP